MDLMTILAIVSLAGIAVVTPGYFSRGKLVASLMATNAGLEAERRNLSKQVDVLKEKLDGYVERCGVGFEPCLGRSISGSAVPILAIRAYDDYVLEALVDFDYGVVDNDLSVAMDRGDRIELTRGRFEEFARRIYEASVQDQCRQWVVLRNGGLPKNQFLLEIRNQVEKFFNFANSIQREAGG